MTASASTPDPASHLRPQYRDHRPPGTNRLALLLLFAGSLIGFVFATLISLSTPFIRALYFIRVEQAGGVRFGLWGWCLETPSAAGPFICEQPPELGYNWPPEMRTRATGALVFWVITMVISGLTLITLIPVLWKRDERNDRVFMYFSWSSSLASFISLFITIGIWSTAKSAFEAGGFDASWGPLLWIGLADTLVLLAVSTGSHYLAPPPKWVRRLSAAVRSSISPRSTGIHADGQQQRYSGPPRQQQKQMQQQQQRLSFLGIPNGGPKAPELSTVTEESIGTEKTLKDDRFLDPILEVDEEAEKMTQRSKHRESQQQSSDGGHAYGSFSGPSLDPSRPVQQLGEGSEGGFSLEMRPKPRSPTASWWMSTPRVKTPTILELPAERSQDVVSAHGFAPTSPISPAPPSIPAQSTRPTREDGGYYTRPAYEEGQLGRPDPKMFSHLYTNTQSGSSHRDSPDLSYVESSSTPPRRQTRAQMARDNSSSTQSGSGYGSVLLRPSEFQAPEGFAAPMIYVPSPLRQTERDEETTPEDIQVVSGIHSTHHQSLQGTGGRLDDFSSVKPDDSLIIPPPSEVTSKGPPPSGRSYKADIDTESPFRSVEASGTTLVNGMRSPGSLTPQVSEGSRNTSSVLPSSLQSRPARGTTPNDTAGSALRAGERRRPSGDSRRRGEMEEPPKANGLAESSSRPRRISAEGAPRTKLIPKDRNGSRSRSTRENGVGTAPIPSSSAPNGRSRSTRGPSDRDAPERRSSRRTPKDDGVVMEEEYYVLKRP